jgi:two-component system sensor histidine kinase DctS
MPLPSQSSDDFALLHASKRALSDRGRWTVLWMMGLVVLVVSAVMALVWYLNSFETEEEERRRGADAQWLEQSVQFHFRRLEDDLAALARQSALDGPQALRAAGQGEGDSAPAGMLWRTPGVVLAHAWLATQGASAGDVRAWQNDQAEHDDNFQALKTLQDIVSGLRRSSYAGPMRRFDGRTTDRVWLAVPYFDGSRLMGIYVAALSTQAAVDALLPPWFLQSQTVRLVVDAVDTPPTDQAQGPYRTVMNLPGTDLMLEVVPQGPQTSPVPRIFFVVALLFLLGMLASLAALRRDFIKRQQVQQRLQAEVALRSAMERSVTIGMRAWDMTGKILYVNQAFCSMVGYSAQELRGARAPLPYWPADQADELALLHRAVISQGTQAQGIEVQFQHRSGHRVDVLIHEAPLTAADGSQLGWMSSVLDISERKRAQQLAALQQEKLEASGRLVAVGEVASTLAHELNQPAGRAGQLCQRPAQPAARRQHYARGTAHRGAAHGPAGRTCRGRDPARQRLCAPARTEPGQRGPHGPGAPRRVFRAGGARHPRGAGTAHPAGLGARRRPAAGAPGAQPVRQCARLGAARHRSRPQVQVRRAPPCQRAGHPGGGRQRPRRA